MKTLLIILYDTGDASCIFWDEPVIVYDLSIDKLHELEDSFSSYYESSKCDDKSYEETTEDVLNASGIKWERFHPGYIENVKYLFV